MPIIKLALVDDHDIVRTGLKTFLNMQPDMQVVAEASSGEEAIIIARQENPDVILMDITMDGMDGLEATRKIKMISPNCRILALTVHADKQYFLKCFLQELRDTLPSMPRQKILSTLFVHFQRGTFICSRHWLAGYSMITNN